MPSFTQVWRVHVDIQMSALSTFRIFTANPVQARDAVSRRPEISRQVEHFTENIGNIKSLDDLMADQQIFSLVMQAYGLEEMIYAKAFVRKILEEGTDDRQSLANRLSDTRYREMAEDFNFDRYGSTTTSFERVQKGVIEKLYQQKMELEAGNQNSGARVALYFHRKSDEIEDAYSILADKALLKFVQTAYGLPVQMSFLSLEKQAEMIDQRLDYSDLDNSEFKQNLLNRFLISWDISNPESVPIPPLISAPSGTFGISQSLLASIQNLQSQR